MTQFCITAQIFGQPGTGRKTLLGQFRERRDFDVSEGDSRIQTTFQVLQETPASNVFCLLAVYDVTRSSTFSYIEQQLEKVRDNQFKIVYIIGTHRDCRPREVKYGDAIALQDKYDGCWGELGLEDAQNFNTIVNRLKIKIRYLIRQLSESVGPECLRRQKNIILAPSSAESARELQIIRLQPGPESSDQAPEQKPSPLDSMEIESDPVAATHVDFFGAPAPDAPSCRKNEQNVDEFGNVTLDLSQFSAQAQSESDKV